MNTTTQTVRERFINQFENVKRKNEIVSFFEKEISEAEARGEARGVKKGGEEAVKECWKIVNDSDDLAHWSLRREFGELINMKLQ